MSKKYYIIVGDLATALIDEDLSPSQLTNATFKELATIVYTEKEFVEAFNMNVIVPAVQYLRVINTSSK